MTTRFVTIETFDGAIAAYTEDDDWRTAINNDNVSDWVWQFADNSEQAVAQHSKKQDEGQADTDAGREQKDTY